MSSLPTRAPAAAVPDRPTPEGERALRQALGYIEGADVPGTRRVYAADWRHFSAWCLQTGLVPLPATPATLAAPAPDPTPNTTPVIPPPGVPGGDPRVQPR